MDTSQTQTQTLPPNTKAFDEAFDLYLQDTSARKIKFWIGNDDHILESHLVITHPDGTTQKVMQFVD